MKNTSKILALVLVLMTFLMSLSVITASAATETVTMVFEASELGLQAQGAYTDGQTVVAGTDDFFTLVMSANVKVDESSKTFEDGYSSSIRVNWGGKSSTSLNLIKFEVPTSATVKVWWVCGGDGRNIAIWDADGTAVAEGSTSVTKNSLYIDTFTLDAAGTYALAGPVGSNYIFKVEVSWVATVCDHVFEDGTCTLCGEPDPNACTHANKSPATCTAPEKCLDCEKELSPALGHTAGEAPTCDTAQTCTVCGTKLADALGHTLTFVNTIPTAEAAGKTVADCSVCHEHFDFGEVQVMTPGTYVLDAADLEGIAQYSLFDGYSKVVHGVFNCHLSYKYATNSNSKTFAEDDWVSTHRMNFGGASGFCNNGEGEDAVRNGGLKNYIQIVTTEETVVTIHWVVGGDGRELGIYDMEGNLVAITNEMGVKNDVVRSENIVLPAGAYLIGSAAPEGGSYIFKVTVEVKAPHVHDWSEATCTEPAKCECGETQGEALGHTWAEATCTEPKTCSACGATEGEALGHEYVDGKCACGAEDPEYNPPVEDEPAEEKELNFFQKIIAFFVELFNKFLAIFKK